MISQMNVVQNAARLAMDHRAAAPRKARPAGSDLSRQKTAVFALAVLIALLASYFFIG